MECLFTLEIDLDHIFGAIAAQNRESQQRVAMRGQGQQLVPLKDQACPAQRIIRRQIVQFAAFDTQRQLVARIRQAQGFLIEFVTGSGGDILDLAARSA